MKFLFYFTYRLASVYFLVTWQFAFVFPWWTIRRYAGGAHRDSFNQSTWTLLGHCFRQTLEGLGATYVKIGQIMSTRPDIFPPWLITELEKLQDAVPPFDSRLIPAEFEKAFGKSPAEIFDRFNETPIASASVAQVHEAWLPSGEHVAVKIRRPGMVEKAEYDLSVMRAFAWSISFIPTVKATSPVESVEEFGKAIRGQLDLRNEARNNKRFHENFANNDHIHFPDLHEDLCTVNILTMEFIDGYKLGEIADKKFNKQVLARQGLRAIFQMIFKDGFVHADLHPGNVRFLEGDVAVYLDLGMIAELTDEARERFIETFMAMADNDGKTVARLMYRYAPWQDVRDYDAYEKDVIRHVDFLFGKPLNEIEVSHAVGKMINILRKHRVRTDATYTVVNISMLVAEGLGRALWPEINLNEELYPYMAAVFQDIMKRRVARMQAGSQQTKTPVAAGTAEA